MSAWLVLACAIASSHPAIATPGSSLPAAKLHRYTMSGYIRPLLFWIGRDDIGLARVVWRQGATGARGYELLIGTDPARAPRSLNRWGYIAEEIRGADASMLALMTRADESSYDEAATSTTAARSRGDFRAIQAAVTNGLATWQVASVHTPQPLTIHDLDAALEGVLGGTTTAARREMRASPDVRPGFLTALAELVDRARQSHPPLQYLFAGKLYELQVRGAQRGTEQVQNAPVRIVRTSFEIRTLATNARTRFEIASGTEGSLAGVPITVEWQPRWWLKVRLKLTD
jgi:hypothetical protein